MKSEDGLRGEIGCKEDECENGRGENGWEGERNRGEGRWARINRFLRRPRGDARFPKQCWPSLLRENKQWPAHVAAVSCLGMQEVKWSGCKPPWKRWPQGSQNPRRMETRCFLMLSGVDKVPIDPTREPVSSRSLTLMPNTQRGRLASSRASRHLQCEA